jgi:hypothetical protein
VASRRSLEISQVGTPVDKIDEFLAVSEIPNEARTDAVQRLV